MLERESSDAMVRVTMEMIASQFTGRRGAGEAHEDSILDAEEAQGAGV